MSERRSRADSKRYGGLFDRMFDHIPLGAASFGELDRDGKFLYGELRTDLETDGASRTAVNRLLHDVIIEAGAIRQEIEALTPEHFYDG